jgi:hypothetical protein
MPVLKPLEKIVKRIENWQEDCALLQHGFRVLLGENTSIADISVNPNGLDKKKKIKTEATIGVNPNTGEASMANNNRVTKLGRTKSKEIQTLQSKGDVIVAGDEEEQTSEKKLGITFDDVSPIKIKKTLSVLESDSGIKELVTNFFKYRMSGNSSKTSDMKDLIDQEIENKDLDALTVYTSISRLDKEEPEESEEPEASEGDNPESEDKKGK